MTTAKKLRASGVVLLALGLLAALIVFCLTRSSEEAGGRGDDLTRKRDVARWEKMGGKSLILFNDIQNWFSSLWHGRRLAYTLGILAIAGFLICRWFADMFEASPVLNDLRPSDDKPA